MRALKFVQKREGEYNTTQGYLRGVTPPGGPSTKEMAKIVEKGRLRRRL